MTRRFWFHVALSMVFGVGVGAAVRALLGSRSPLNAFPKGAAAWAVLVVATLGIVFFFARLLLRSTGSDRTTGLLGLYAATLCPPVVWYITGSIANAATILLVLVALVEILEVDLEPSGAWRSGLSLSIASLLDPTCLVVAAAFVPVVGAVARPRWKALTWFVLAAAVPWTLAVRFFDLERGEIALAPPSLQSLAALAGKDWWVSTLASAARAARATVQDDFLSPYAAFALVGAIGTTVRRLGPSRRSLTVALWMFAVALAVPRLLEIGSASVLVALRFVLLVLLANMGLASLAAMNPLHAGRRRMIPVGVFFLLPIVVAWVKVVV